MRSWPSKSKKSKRRISRSSRTSLRRIGAKPCSKDPKSATWSRAPPRRRRAGPIRHPAREDGSRDRRAEAVQRNLHADERPEQAPCRGRRPSFDQEPAVRERRRGPEENRGGREDPGEVRSRHGCLCQGSPSRGHCIPKPGHAQAGRRTETAARRDQDQDGQGRRAGQLVYEGRRSQCRTQACQTGDRRRRESTGRGRRE